jgi:site-specific DNA recombinase
LEAQKAKLEMYCMGNDLQLLEVISDEISGKNLKRPGFQRVIEMAKAKEIECFLCCKLDRVSRSVKDVIYLVELFDKYGVGFVSLAERLDTSSAMGKFIINLLASLAELERNIISERTRTALDYKISKGERVGMTAFGWDLGADGKTLVPNPKEQDAVSLIHSLRSQGWGYRKICRELERRQYQPKAGKWHHSKIINILAYHKRRTTSISDCTSIL